MKSQKLQAILFVSLALLSGLPVVGCGGASENTVVAPKQSDDELRAETEAKMEKLKNIDPASL